MDRFIVRYGFTPLNLAFTAGPFNRYHLARQAAASVKIGGKAARFVQIVKEGDKPAVVYSSF